MTVAADPQEPSNFAIDVDPVCGRPLQPTFAAQAPRVERDGESYVFCSDACRAAFLLEPERYIDVGDDAEA
ncbi:MAG: YHS domain-containing protein [Deltaproteobacteria bacterium]|nr:YHS domain-containing protein [Deltaproteobacteria bacterium]